MAIISSSSGTSEKRRINIDEPRWDQSTYLGRAMHFFTTTDPRNLLCSSQELDEAKLIVTRYRAGDNLEHLSEDEIWRAKHVYDSAFHPDTGEKMLLVGRMSAQVPMNMMITAAMLTFYKTTGQVIFWQWFNQSFNAVVNYTNRSGSSPIPVSQLGVSYVSATSAALVTALSLNKLVKRAPPLLGRFVPFVAVAAANCINIPLMRQKEIKEGIEVFDENGNKLGQSKVAAKKAIREVVASRIAMASPGMVLPPIVMNSLEKRGVLKRFPGVSLPIQTALCGTLLIFATPMCCAIFPQRSSLPIVNLEPELKPDTKDLDALCYFNKGL
uniref:Sidoreflexin n=1 Tax=Aceria tosichella TaxID=561515 RepID=A0A6G1SDM9_9ACAR